MIGSECDTINQTLTSLLRDRLGERLFAIIATGSIASGAFTPHWSDIDLLVIVDSLDIETKRRLASAAKAIQDKFETHCGLNVLTTLEATQPILPLQMMEGKI